MKIVKVDVSEIKTYRSCRRQWLLSSRNRFHMRPKIAPPAFAFGTIFHEALGELYLGVSEDKVLEMVQREADKDSYVALLAMIKGYAHNVLPEDLARFKVLDIEHHFEFTPSITQKTPEGVEYVEVVDPDLLIIGSIDMIVLDVEENKIYGFEHKTCKTFRDTSYLWMDEQPRIYTAALQLYIEKYNQSKMVQYYKDLEAWDSQCQEADQRPDEPVPATLGGIYMNEVKKLLRDFQYNRTLCVYPDTDMENFLEAFFGSCCACKHSVEVNDVAPPNPSYFTCQMCSFKDVCSTYMYATLNEAKVLEEFADTFEKRTEDHLDEKLERSGE